MLDCAVYNHFDGYWSAYIDGIEKMMERLFPAIKGIELEMFVAAYLQHFRSFMTRKEDENDD